MSVEKTGRPVDPYSRLGEAKKQIHLSIDGCEEDADARELRKALALIERVCVESQPMIETN